MIELKHATKRRIREIILHCSANKEGKHITVEDIDKYHRSLGWAGCGYHYVIYLDGSIHVGRDVDLYGAHCQKHNKQSIGICYIGGLDINGQPKDTRTPEQKESLLLLVKTLLNKYQLSIGAVYGHYIFARKSCPCFDVAKFKHELEKLP